MSVYKVPQDVEADDKLLGPFTFRQFIYLIIVAGSLALGYVLASQIFIGLGIIVLPVVVFFGALALPIKKDQPMEAYLAAIVSFYLKPRKRLWRSEGVESTIEITVPKKVEESRTKDLSEHEASRRLSYLANIMDTEGWAVKGVSNGPLREDVYAETMGVRDMLDTAAPEVANLDQMISKTTKSHHEQLLNNTRLIADGGTPVVSGVGAAGAGTGAALAKPIAPPKAFEVTIPDAPPVANVAGVGVAEPSVAVAQAPVVGAAPAVENLVSESVVEEVVPVVEAVVAAEEIVSPTPVVEEVKSVEVVPEVEEVVEPVVSDDILRLLNNKDLSVETIAKEAKRLREMEEAADGEVYVSLR